jgi:futalosine hydrolase
MEINTMGKILVVTSVEAEKHAVEAGIRGDSRFCVALCGVGPFEAAVQTTKLLATGDYELVINAGIAGGFVGRASVGSLVFGSTSIATQLGAEDQDGSFIRFDQLGFGGIQQISHVDEALLSNWQQKLEHSVIAPILTVTTVTGSHQSTRLLEQTYPMAAAEAMEGFSVASAAVAFGVPFVEVRAISNPIGPRDRAAWNIPTALACLQNAFAVLTEVV